MNAFHVCGGLLAVWAVVLSFVGITREDFPATPGAGRLIATVSVLLALAAIGTAIYTSATEEEDEGEGEQALVLRV